MIKNKKEKQGVVSVLKPFGVAKVPHFFELYATHIKKNAHVV